MRRTKDRREVAFRVAQDFGNKVGAANRHDVGPMRRGPGDSQGQLRLARARRAVEQHAARRADPETVQRRRVLQRQDDGGLELGHNIVDTMKGGE